MPPLLHSDDGRNTVIRPLAYAPEEEIAAYATLRQFPIIPCDLCGSQENLQRKKMKRMLDDLEKEHPHIRASVLSAMGNVRPSHLIDRTLRLKDATRPPPSVRTGESPWLATSPQ